MCNDSKDKKRGKNSFKPNAFEAIKTLVRDQNRSESGIQLSRNILILIRGYLARHCWTQSTRIWNDD